MIEFGGRRKVNDLDIYPVEFHPDPLPLFRDALYISEMPLVSSLHSMYYYFELQEGDFWYKEWRTSIHEWQWRNLIPPFSLPITNSYSSIETNPRKDRQLQGKTQVGAAGGQTQ